MAGRGGPLLRVRFVGAHINAFCGKPGSFLRVQASSKEIGEGGEGQSLEAARFVGETLAQRLKDKQIGHVKLRVGDNYVKNQLFHDCVKLIIELVEKNGVYVN